MSWFDQFKDWANRKDPNEENEDDWPNDGTLPPAPRLTWNLANKRTFAESLMRNRPHVVYFYDEYLTIKNRPVTVRFDVHTISLWDGNRMFFEKRTSDIVQKDIENAVAFLFQR